MIVKVKENEVEKKLEFPCLMKYTDFEVVLLVSAINNNGSFKAVCVSSFEASSYRIGDFDGGWSAHNLVPFKGSITLSND
tara:strand:- start:68 stop:307 length:240 start_codon:yes stop_codon:yes gene_type:complete